MFIWCLHCVVNVVSCVYVAFSIYIMLLMCCFTVYIVSINNTDVFELPENSILIFVVFNGLACVHAKKPSFVVGFQKPY